MKINVNDWRLWLPAFFIVLAVRADGQLLRPTTGVAVGMVRDDIEVQTSGPVHEGFASPVVFDDESEGYYVEVDPPYVIDEMPPFERPAGYAEWIPGYWSWDDDGRAWIWVSGTWRTPPPGHAWVSGYWIRTWRGWRYVSGYWAPTGYGGVEVDYLPAPPPPFQLGPIGYPPAPNAIWIPGNWVWYWGGYLGWMWRPGYWVVINPGWVWVPASYVWTPYGYVYVEGHWDYPVEHCGILFAPVRFTRPVFLASAFSFSPGFVINITLFGAGFFTRPAYGHYYFGDYYAESYWNHGIYPAFSFHYSRYGYDPQFAYASWRYGERNPRWVEEQRTHFLYLRDHEDARPPRTLAQQTARRTPMRLPPGVEPQDGRAVAVSLRDAAVATRLKVERVPESDRAKVAGRAKDMQRARGERAKTEAAGGPLPERVPETPRKLKIGAFVPGTAGERPAGSLGPPPKAPELPKAQAGPDPRLDAKTRGVGVAKGRKLRNPSMDLPSERLKEEESDDAPVRKPGDVGKPPVRKPVVEPPKKAGEDVPPRKPEDVGKPPVRKPVVEPPKKAGEDAPPRKPEDVGKPPVRKPVVEPPKKAGEDAPPRKPEDAGKPPVRKPVVDPPKKAGEGPASRKPGEVIKPPARKPVGPPSGKRTVEPPTVEGPPAKPPGPIPVPYPREGPGRDPKAEPPQKPAKQGAQPESKPVRKPGFTWPWERKPGEKQ